MRKKQHLKCMAKVLAGAAATARLSDGSEQQPQNNENSHESRHRRMNGASGVAAFM
jgi:hypothetical protein